MSIKTAFKYVNSALGLVIFVVGVVGNGTLLRILYQNRAMRTGPNALMGSLALGDLIYITIDIPINIYKVGSRHTHTHTHVETHTHLMGWVQRATQIMTQQTADSVLCVWCVYSVCVCVVCV